MKKASYIFLGLILSFKINSQIQLISISNPTSSNSEDGAIDILITPTSSLYKYYWNTGDTSEDLNNLLPGFYSVTITGGSLCWAEAHFHLLACDDTLITEPFALNYQTVWNAETSLSDVYTSVEGGANYRFYKWNYGEGMISTEVDLLDMPQGIYYLEVYDGCTHLYDTIFLGPPPILPLKSANKKFSPNSDFSIPYSFKDEESEYYNIYPNPFQDEFILDIQTARKGTFEIKINDILGNEVFTLNKISIAEQWIEKIILKEIYSSGIYYVQISQDGKILYLTSIFKVN